MQIAIPVSPGELLDKISILQIKSERINNADKLANVRHELGLLERAWRALDAESDRIAELRVRLRQVNQQLWEIEDAIRDKEAEGDFGAGFIDLARSVYQRNDQRALIKRKINEALGAEIIEEKSYSEYRVEGH